MPPRWLRIGPDDHTAEAAIVPALAELLAELRLNPSGIQHRRGACQSPSPSADNDAFKCALGSPLRIDPMSRSVPLCRSSSPTCRYLLVVFKGRAEVVANVSQVDGLIGHVGPSSVARCRCPS